MKRCVVLLLALAGCPAKGGTGPVAPVGGGGSCPAANGVYMASYLQPEEGAKGATHTGWVLPLADKAVATVQGQPEFTELDAAAAQTAGVPAPPANLWLLAPGAPPCKVTAGAFYAAAIDEGTPNLSYGVELTGCAAPQDAQNATAMVLVSETAPGDCQLLPPKPAAARLGEPDQQGRWQRPTKETPIPPAFAAVVPQHECAAPACEKLYAVASVEIGGKPVVWAGAVNWLRADAGDPCKWKGDTFSGFFVVSGETLVQVTEGQEHPLALAGVLADRGGARVLVAQGPGEYATYDLAADGKASVGRHLVWLLPDPASYAAVAALNPDCAM
jgi:hypothetical protein